MSLAQDDDSTTKKDSTTTTTATPPTKKGANNQEEEVQSTDDDVTQQDEDKTQTSAPTQPKKAKKSTKEATDTPVPAPNNGEFMTCEWVDNGDGTKELKCFDPLDWNKKMMQRLTNLSNECGKVHQQASDENEHGKDQGELDGLRKMELLAVLYACDMIQRTAVLSKPLTSASSTLNY